MSLSLLPVLATHLFLSNLGDNRIYHAALNIVSLSSMSDAFYNSLPAIGIIAATPSVLSSTYDAFSYIKNKITGNEKQEEDKIAEYLKYLSQDLIYNVIEASYSAASMYCLFKFLHNNYINAYNFVATKLEWIPDSYASSWSHQIKDFSKISPVIIGALCCSALYNYRIEMKEFFMDFYNFASRVYVNLKNAYMYMRGDKKNDITDKELEVVIQVLQNQIEDTLTLYNEKELKELEALTSVDIENFELEGANAV